MTAEVKTPLLDTSEDHQYGTVNGHNHFQNNNVGDSTLVKQSQIQDGNTSIKVSDF